MKSTLIAISLFCGVFLNSYSQQVNVTFNYFTDLNGDCVKQSNEKTYNNNGTGGVYQGTNSVGSESNLTNHQLSLQANSSYTIKTTQLFSNTDYLIFNCDSSNFYKFSIGSSDTTINLPLKDSLYMLLNSFPPKLSSVNGTGGYCINDTAYLSILEWFKSPGTLLIEINWGDGIRDTLDASSSFIAHFPKVPHLYQSKGNYNLEVRAYTKGWVLIDSNILYCNVSVCSYVQGKLFADMNSNCLYNVGVDSLLSQYCVIIKDTNGVVMNYVFSDSAGNYKFAYDSSNSFKVYAQDYVACNNQLKYFTVGPWNSSILTKDIPFSKDSIDYRVYAFTRGVIFPGDSSKLHIGGQGIIKATTPYKYSTSIPNKSTVLRANNSTLSIVLNKAHASYSSNSFWNYFLYKFDTTVTASDTFCFKVKLDKIGNDPNLLNNETTFCRQAFNSYDPNDKQVAIKSMLAGGNFTDKDDEFNYTIRFQNTGNAPAKNIKIQDDIDSKLDLSTFRFLGSSHNSTITIGKSRNLQFEFKNINLIDSASNPEESQGFVTYSIKPMSGLKLGEEIQNTARIYFDFNPPIITNTTKNRYVDPSAPNLNEKLKIMGMVYQDINLNCKFDASEDQLIENYKFDYYDSGFNFINEVYTNSQGIYEIEIGRTEKAFLISYNHSACGSNSFFFDPSRYSNFNVIIQDLPLDSVGRGISSLNIATKDQDLFIYPNPVKGILNVNNALKKEYLIFDPTGKLQIKGNCEGQIDLYTLKKGMYFLQLNMEDKNYQFKFVKD